MRITTLALFDATEEQVWTVLTDWERQASWMPDVAWIRVLGPERGLNARLTVRTKLLGVPLITDRLQVVVWNPPRRLMVRHLGLVRGTGEWLLENRGADRTWFRWTEDLSLNIPWIGDLLVSVYAPVLRATFRRSTRNLRREIARS